MHKQDKGASVCLPLNDAVSCYLQQRCAASGSQSRPRFQKGERDCGAPKSEQWRDKRVPALPDGALRAHALLMRDNALIIDHRGPPSQLPHEKKTQRRIWNSNPQRQLMLAGSLGAPVPSVSREGRWSLGLC